MKERDCRMSPCGMHLPLVSGTVEHIDGTCNVAALFVDGVEVWRDKEKQYLDYEDEGMAARDIVLDHLIKVLDR